MKLEHVDEKMTLKEIMDMDPSMETELFQLGFNACCSKMEKVEDIALDKGIDLKRAIDTLNGKIDEINTVSELLEDYQ